MEKEDIFDRAEYPNRKEWLKLRGRGIGGSDASIILGLSNWKTNNQLWIEKTTSVLEEDFQPNESEENAYIVYGKTVEDSIRTIFQAKFVNELKVKHTDQILIRKDKQYLRASLDGEIEVLEDFDFTSYDRRTFKLKKGMKGILEIKTKFAPEFTEWRDSIPQNYYAQGVHYLNVTGWDFVIYCAELRYPDGFSCFRHFLFMRDNVLEDIKFLEEEEDKFWEKVVSKKEVPLTIKL